MTSTAEVHEAVTAPPIDDGYVVRNLATDIISAYVANNAVRADELPGIMGTVYSVVSGWGGRGAAPGAVVGGTAGPPAETPAYTHSAKMPRPDPAVPIKKSVTADYIICLEDGKHFKSLKRHLASAYGMTPEEYRDRWGLPSDYPMVSPNYTQQRSALAKTMGLGRTAATANKGRRKAPVAAE